MKNRILVGAIALGLAAPAMAQGNSTLATLVAKGAVVKAEMQGQALELGMTYKADGTYTASAMGQEIGGGTWKIDGDKLCTASQLGESCTVYPNGKAAGDEFKMTHATLGEITVKINP